MTTCYLALGSNLNDPVKQVSHAIKHIKHMKQTKLTGISHFYESSPLDNSAQNNYINAVVSIETSLLPDQLLHQCQLIENKLGKLKLYHWGPRTIDIDIVLYGHYVICEKNIVIPHPGITERDFVIKPLLDINPNLTLPNGNTLKSYLSSCTNNQLEQVLLVRT